MSSHSNWHRKWLNSNWTVKLFYKDNRFFCEKAPVWTSGLHHGLKQKQKADYGISSKSKTKRLIFLGKFRTISHYMCCTLSMLQMVFPHIPFIYIVVLFGSDQLVYFQLHLHLRWWLCGLKGSVDITFKAWSSVLPLSQEMRVSHGLCLLQEKQQATWESAGSHDLYQRFLWTNQAESLTYGGDGHMLRCFAKPRPALVPVHSNPKLSFKVDRAVWNVKVLSRCLIINPNCRVNEKHGLIFFFFFWSAESFCMFEMPQIQLQLTKWLFIQVALHSWVRNWNKTTQEFHTDYLRKGTAGPWLSHASVFFWSRKHVTWTVDALCKAVLERT